MYKNERETIKDEGLSSAEVEVSRRNNGANVMSRAKGKSFLSRFVSNLGDPVVKILIGALILNLIFTFRHADWFEVGGIAISILLATFISTLSEHGSEAAFVKLKQASERQRVRAIRDGEICEINVSDVVVGDVIEIGAGEQIAADGFLARGNIAVDQSSMTGESREVYKRERYNEDERGPASPSYCLRGCTVVSGEGRMVVDRV